MCLAERACILESNLFFFTKIGVTNLEFSNLSYNLLAAFHEIFRTIFVQCGHLQLSGIIQSMDMSIRNLSRLAIASHDQRIIDELKLLKLELRKVFI